MRVLLAIVAVAACSSSTRTAPREDHHPCDPASKSAPTPEPPGQAPMVCGNGVVDAHDGPCEEICSYGCSSPEKCTTECQHAAEQCDGNAPIAATCETGNYVSGSVRCTPDCLVDYRECVACVDGPDARCGRWDAPIKRSETPDQAFVVASSNGAAAAVFVRESATGRIRGATVSATLAVKPLNVSVESEVAYVVNDGLGFVDKKRRYGTIDHTGRVRMLGPIVAAATGSLEIYRETDRPSGAVVYSTGQPQTLTIFGKGELPRHFYLSNRRIVLYPPGDTVLMPDFTNVRTLKLDADGTMTPMENFDSGVTFSFVFPIFTDKVADRVLTRRTEFDLKTLPSGVGKIAVAGASTASAFGGTLHARIDDGRVSLTWTRP
jgi:hypothetical protein